MQVQKNKKRQLLFVTSSEKQTDALEKILEQEYSICRAEPGEQAVKLLRNEGYCFSAALIDLTISGKSGYNLIEKMQKSGWTKDLPVIAVLPVASEEMTCCSKELGVSDFIRAPFDAQIVLCRVKNVITLHEQKFRDHLTGIYNRKGFIRMTERVLAHCKDRMDYAVLFFNFRNFKAINELFGTAGGDAILIQFAEKLQNSFLQPVISARVDSDHFVCLVKKENLDLEQLSSFCEHLHEQDGRKMWILRRCGIYYVKEEEMPISGMIDRAKLAKEYIVDEYVQPYAVYSRDMKESYIDQAEVCSEFENGIQNEEFQVYFQPIVNAQTGKIASAEALVRWQHPKKGLISPGVFIPALEKDGYISRLDGYVLEKVSRFQEERNDAGLPVVPVSVNLSWMDFYDETLMNRVKRTSEIGKLQLGMLRYEMTETSYAALVENNKDILREIQDRGVEIMLDDFGSGYSSFDMLQKYSFDIIKLDMSFSRQIETNEKTRKLLPLIMDAAHEFGGKVVVEGVETKEQADFLKEHGCDYIQGFYYYRPMPGEQFAKLLETELDKAVK